MEKSGKGAVSAPDRRHGQQEGAGIIGEFGDLDIQANRVRLIESMILDRIIAPLYRDANGFEAALMMLPRSTVNKVVATHGELYEAHRQSASLVLQGFKSRYVPECDFEAIDAPGQG